MLRVEATSPPTSTCAVGGEQHAVGVDQKDLAVGGKGALDHRYIRAQHTVQGYGGSRGLDEVDAVALPDGKALPVRCHAVAGLRDCHGGAGLADAAGPGDDLSSSRQIRGARICRPCQQRSGDERNGFAGFLAARPDILGNGDVGVMDMAPDDAIGVIEAGALHCLLPNGGRNSGLLYSGRMNAVFIHSSRNIAGLSQCLTAVPPAPWSEPRRASWRRLRGTNAKNGVR
jgi:hypothetical protein